MISPIVSHRSPYAAIPKTRLLTTHANPSVHFGHGAGHVHADGRTCTDKHCSEGKKGERQFFWQPLWNWVKETWQKIKDFCSRLIEKLKGQESATTTASTSPITPTTPAAQVPTTQDPKNHDHQEGHGQHVAHDHKHGKCCGGHPPHAQGSHAKGHP